jgi:pimeloyl-ACP methyl ester carboxylesterase
VTPVLDRWRQATKNQNAKLIFICHSMGGLVARYFLEVLGGRELTSKLITIGTPYQGSINALDAMVNGLFLGFGPIGFSVDKLVRSFPAVHQLLPTYDCLDVGDGQLRNLSGRDLPNVGKNEVTEALAFHSRIAVSIEKNSKYETFAIKGVDQPTSQSALLRNGKIEAIQCRDRRLIRRSGRTRDHPCSRLSLMRSCNRRILSSHRFLECKFARNNDPLRGDFRVQ